MNAATGQLHDQFLSIFYQALDFSWLKKGHSAETSHSFCYVMPVAYFFYEVRLNFFFDLCTGTSDPYVKFKIGNKLCYRSRTVYRNLNPRWNERFSVPIEDIRSTVLRIKVFDYDRGLHDDRMGCSVIRLCELVPNQLVL